MSTGIVPRPVFGQDTPKWTPPIVKRSAVISPNREYRYHLIRTWNTAKQVADIARELTPSVYCLGRTKDRSPRHPLYVARGTDLEPYR